LLKKVACLSSASRAFLVGRRYLGARVRSFANRGRPAPESEVQAWQRRLPDERKALLSLVHGMEAEFLATGDGLEGLSRELDEIQRECQLLTDLTLGMTQDAAVQFAFQLLKKAEDLVLASYDQYDHVFATFNELQQRLAQASQQRDELMRVLLPLHFITMSFRIEASRHPVDVQQAFFTLSDNVNRTVHDVRAAMERQFDDLAASERIARSLVAQIADAVQKHRAEISATLAASRAQLHALGEAFVRSGAGAAELTQRNQAATRHIGGLVMALQCQDMTSQRIQHVADAIAEMGDLLADGQPDTPAAHAEARRFIFHAGQIQSRQVQSVFHQLNHAADSLKSGIQMLRTEAGAAAERAIKVGSATLDARVARQCQAGISQILDIVKQVVQKIAAITSAFAPLQASFVDCTGKATALAGDVRLAGLNAQIYAIHTSDGATLEVLAGRVHGISAEVIGQVETMGALLNHMSEMVNNLRQRLEDFQILGQAEQAVLADESALSMQKLADLEIAIPLHIQSVTQRQESFAASAEKVLAKIQFPATVAQANSQSIRFFEDLLAWSGAGGSASFAEAAASEKIDRLKSKYTMESERHAHADALQATPKTADVQPEIEWFGDPALPPPAPPSAPVIPPDADPGTQPRPPALSQSEAPSSQPALTGGKSPAGAELGNNVELF
jgi:hypothetical protein